MTLIDTRRKNDVFANIAAQTVVHRTDGLRTPAPAALPDTELPLESGGGPAGALPGKWPEKMNNAEQLGEALAVMRRRFAPFLQDLAPALPETRVRRALTHFEVGQIDPAEPGTAPTSWEQVTIPHYGGPTVRHTTWYRTRFDHDTDDLPIDGVALIRFKGVDYRAHVFLNGAYLGSHEGFFAPFHFDMTPHLREGENTLTVRVENDEVGEKIYAATGPGWDEPGSGWHHCPPGMGIYQDVAIEFGNAIQVHDLFVRPSPETQTAEAWIEVVNFGDADLKAWIDLSVYGQNFRHTVVEHLRHDPTDRHVIGEGDSYQEARAVRHGTLDAPIDLLVKPGVNRFKIPLDMPDFRTWSPDEPWLYQAQVRLMSDAHGLHDASAKQFGMRSFVMETDHEPRGQFRLNGQRIRLRGSNTMGYMQQDVMRRDFPQLIDDILLAKTCHLNFLRLTQRPTQDEIYDHCDRLGMMLQTDLPLFGSLRRTKLIEAVKQASEMERLVRSHPSNIMVSYINEPTRNGDNLPQMNLDRSAMEDFFRAADIVVRLENPDRVIKPADGDYDPPVPGYPDRHCYSMWYNGQGIDAGRMHKGFGEPIQPGWYFGCGEFGAEALDTAELMHRRYPKAWLPQNQANQADHAAHAAHAAWTPHRICRAQTGNFYGFFYERPQDFHAWIQASRRWQAWALGLQMRAFRRQPEMNSTANHLFIDAWPAGWMKAIIDCERQPKPGYFAYRDALKPLLVDLRTDRFAGFSGQTLPVELWVCNDRDKQPTGLELIYRVELDGQTIAHGRADADVPACAPQCQGVIHVELPEVDRRACLIVRAALIGTDDRRVRDDHQWTIDVWPRDVRSGEAGPGDIRPGDVEFAQSTGIEVPHPRGPLGEYLEHLGWVTVDEVGSNDPPPVLLIETYAAYENDRAAIDSAVRSGARAVIVGLPSGDYQIGDARLSVRASAMNPMHFADRSTGHELVRGFEPDDFRYWFDETEGYITPLISHTFTADAFEPVLATINVDESGQWGPAMGCGVLGSGAGEYIVCQIDLAGRLKTNPAAWHFARKLFVR